MPTYSNILNPFTGKLQKVTDDTDTTAGWTTDNSTKTTTPYNVGIGSSATTPRGIFDVNEQTTYTIGDVTTSDSAIYPTYAAGFATAADYEWTYWVYAYRTVNGVQIFSANPLVFTFHDNASLDSMFFTFSWTAVANADGYRIIVVEDNQYGSFGDNYTDIPSAFTSAIYYQDDTDGYETNSATYYSGGNTVTPTSTAYGPNFYIDEITGKYYSQGAEVNWSQWTGTTSLSYTGAVNITGALTASSLTLGTDLSVSNGGTGASSFTSTQVLVGNGTSAITSSSGFTFNTATGLVTINNGNSTSLALNVTGNNFTRFAVNNTNASGSGSLYAIASFNMQTTLSYVQFAAYGNGTNNGSRWGMSLNGVAELTHVSLGGAVAMVIGTYDSLPLVFGSAQTERFRLNGAGGLTFAEGNNFAFGTSTGTKIGTATSQKIGFFNATPIVQVVATTDLGTVLSNLGLRAAGTAYPITTSGAVNLTGGLTIATTDLTITDRNVILSATTGTKIGTATTQKLGFYNATPIVQPSAYTQTYSTASKTNPTATAANLVTTAATQVTPWGFASQAQAEDIATQVNKMQTDYINAQKILNAIIDDLQALGLVA